MTQGFANSSRTRHAHTDVLSIRTERVDTDGVLAGGWKRLAVLLVDDDIGTRETVDWALRAVGLQVATATSGAEGIAIASARAFQLMLIDLRLGDMLGTEVVRALRQNSALVPFVLISGFLTTTVAVEAMKLGAMDVIEKPVAVDCLLAIVRSAVGEPHNPSTAEPFRPSRMTVPAAVAVTWDVTRPGSVAERWAMYVLKACGSDRDLKTLDDWATCVGVSYSSLRECCGLAGIRPHDARDFTRVLRVLINAHRDHSDPKLLLDVSDERTLETLLTRAGLGDSEAISISVQQFLESQRFIPLDNAGLRILRTLLGRQLLA